MAKVVIVSIKTEPAATAIKACANSAAMTLTGSGGDTWATDGTANVSTQRSFTVTVENYPEEGEE